MKSPVLCADEVIEYTSLWDIGSTGAHTKVSGVPGTGFSGIARSATGKYTITFSGPGVLPVGKLIDLVVTHWPAADAANLNLRPSKATWTPETSTTAATVKYEAWDNDTTAQTELASGDQVSVTAKFLKTKGS